MVFVMGLGKKMCFVPKQHTAAGGTFHENMHQA
jgi:hypothetical protein